MLTGSLSGKITKAYRKGIKFPGKWEMNPFPNRGVEGGIFMSEKKNKTKVGEVAIYDARQLGVPRMLVLGVQHTFAMFGATVLVPILTGLNVSTTLLMAGLGTLLFHLITKGKVPAFLGSSFAFLGGYSAVAPRLADGASNAEMLPYACGGVFGCGTGVCLDVRTDFSLWYSQNHALFPGRWSPVRSSFRLV